MGEQISTLFNNNPYFGAGVGLLGISAIFTGTKQGILRLLFFAQRKYLTTLEVTSRDPSHGWIVYWLSRQALLTGSHFTASTRAESKSSLSVSLSPSPGTHYLRWNKTWIKVHRERERAALMDIHTGTPFETITLTSLGRRPELFVALLKEAQCALAEQQEGKLMIYTSWAAEWRPFGSPRRKRSLDSIVFERGIKESIVSDVREFLASSRWYFDRGIPYRRGYLLHGPPGGGKSSFVQALASELGYSICLLNLGESSVSDDRLNHLLHALPERSILLLEDIDSVPVVANAHDSAAPPNRLTFSGLLNALDGVASSEERLIFMTTNHYDRLQASLIRPGRIDYQQYIGPANDDQIRRMFCRFYPGYGHLAEAFATILKGSMVSPAAIQGHFIVHKDSAVSALEDAASLKGIPIQVTKETPRANQIPPTQTL